MNSTFVGNSTKPTAELWFIPVDILVITCLVLATALAIIYLFIIVVDKKCHTVRMMLIANICLNGLICGIAHLSMAAFTLQNDLKQIEYEDSFCIFRGYMSYASIASFMYSYLLLAIYQYISIVYPNRVFLKSARIQIVFIVVALILAYAFPIPVIASGAITYIVDNQICQVPFRFSFSIIYIPQFVFIIPVNLLGFFYMKLVRYVREMGKRVTVSNTLSRAQRDLKMVRRIVILVHILLIGGMPMTIFIFLSFANATPKYNMRIGFTFVDIGLLSVMITLFIFTDLLKNSIRTVTGRQANVVIPTAMNHPPIFIENKSIGKRVHGSIQSEKVEILKYQRVTILKQK